MAKKNAFADMAGDIAAFNAKNENTVQVNEYDQLFRTTDYDMFAPYPNEELRLPLHTGQKYDDLEKSILDHGITTPIKVIRAKDSDFKGIAPNKLIVIGGHNRLEIAKKNNLEVLYNILKPMSNEECDLIMSEEVILNRQMDELSPMQIVHILVPMYKGSNIREVEDKLKDSANALSYVQISRYLKLLSLIPEFQTWVDEKRVTVMDAQILCKIPAAKQSTLYKYLENYHISKLNKKQIEGLLRIVMEDWNDPVLNSIFVKDTIKPSKNLITSKKFKSDLKPITNMLKEDIELNDDGLAEYKDLIEKLELLLDRYRK